MKYDGIVINMAECHTSVRKENRLGETHRQNELQSNEVQRQVKSTTC